MVAVRMARTARMVREIQPSQAKAIMAVRMRHWAKLEQKARSGQILCGDDSARGEGEEVRRDEDKMPGKGCTET